MAESRSGADGADGLLDRATRRAGGVSTGALVLLWVVGLALLVVLDQLVLEVPPHPAASAVADVLHPFLRLLVVGGLAALTLLRLRARRPPR